MLHPSPVLGVVGVQFAINPAVFVFSLYELVYLFCHCVFVDHGFFSLLLFGVFSFSEMAASGVDPAASVTGGVFSMRLDGSEAFMP